MGKRERPISGRNVMKASRTVSAILPSSRKNSESFLITNNKETSNGNTKFITAFRCGTCNKRFPSVPSLHAHMGHGCKKTSTGYKQGNTVQHSEDHCTPFENDPTVFFNLPGGKSFFYVYTLK